MIRTWACLNHIYKRHRVFLLHQSCRSAGHSKWQNIKHIKAEKDAQKSILFTKLSRLMRVAIEEGKTADPSSNLKLSQLIEQAKKANMPAASINKILQEKIEPIQYLTVEIIGRGGSAFIVNCASGNLNKVKMNINTILRKTNGEFSIGNVKHLFKVKGIVITDTPSNTSTEDAIDVALEIDVEDVSELKDESNGLQFTCDPLKLKKIKTELEKRNYTVSFAEVFYEPLSHVVVEDSYVKSVTKLYEQLRGIQDIHDVFDNLLWPENS